MIEKIKDFLKTRPSVTLYELCKESGASYWGWYKILRNERKLTEKYRQEFPAMYGIMKKYGYESSNNSNRIRNSMC